MEVNRGGRPKKLQVELNEDGLKDILQRVYVEAEDIRQKSLLIFNKSSRKMKDVNEIALIGKTTAEYLKIAASATTSKLQVAKMVQDQIIKSATAKEDSNVDGGYIISDSMKQEIAELQADLKNQLKRLPEDNGNMINVEESLNNIENKELEKIKSNNGK